MTAITFNEPAVAGAARNRRWRCSRAIEASRFARHPLFLICAGLLAYSVYQMHADMYANEDHAPLELSLSPACLMGLDGMVVAYRLTRSTRRADEAIDGSPSDEPTRTAALLLACLVPFSVAALSMAHLIIAWHLEPTPGSRAGTTSRRRSATR